MLSYLPPLDIVAFAAGGDGGYEDLKPRVRCGFGIHPNMFGWQETLNWWVSTSSHPRASTPLSEFALFPKPENHILTRDQG